MSLKDELNSNALRLVFGKSEKGFLLAPLNSTFEQQLLSELLIRAAYHYSNPSGPAYQWRCR